MGEGGRGDANGVELTPDDVNEKAMLFGNTERQRTSPRRKEDLHSLMAGF